MNPHDHLRVLHVIPSVATRYGGPSGVILHMVSALNNMRKVRAEIATTDADGKVGRILRQQLPSDPPIHLFHCNWSERWKVSTNLWTWLRRNVDRFDLLHLHAVWSFSTCAASRAAHRNGIPYIVRPAGMLSDYSWQRNRRLKKMYWNAVERSTFENATAIHVTSDVESSEVHAICPKARAYLINNGIDGTAFSCDSDKTQLGKLCGESATKLPIILFFSRLHPKKGIVDRLLPAFLKLKTPCILALVGGYDPHAAGHEREVRQAIVNHRLQERVFMLGHVDGDKRWAMYDGADLFVLPSHSENFGIVVAEAMARGCPVVVTEAVQSCTHVRAAEAGEVVSGDIDELATTLNRLLAQPEKRIAFGEAGRRYANEHFRWEQIAQQIYTMYCDCLNCR